MAEEEHEEEVAEVVEEAQLPFLEDLTPAKNRRKGKEKLIPFSSMQKRRMKTKICYNWRDSK